MSLENPFSSEGEDDNLEEERKLIFEVLEGNEVFRFPGLREGSYESMRALDETYPGFMTPIDDIIGQMQAHGCKIVCGKFQALGNIFVVPNTGDADPKMDGIPLRYIDANGMTEGALKDLVNLAKG